MTNENNADHNNAADHAAGEAIHNAAIAAAQAAEKAADTGTGEGNAEGATTTAPEATPTSDAPTGFVAPPQNPGEKAKAYKRRVAEAQAAYDAAQATAAAEASSDQPATGETVAAVEGEATTTAAPEAPTNEPELPRSMPALAGSDPAAAVPVNDCAPFAIERWPAWCKWRPNRDDVRVALALITGENGGKPIKKPHTSNVLSVVAGLAQARAENQADDLRYTKYDIAHCISAVMNSGPDDKAVCIAELEKTYGLITVVDRPCPDKYARQLGDRKPRSSKNIYLTSKGLKKAERVFAANGWGPVPSHHYPQPVEAMPALSAPAPVANTATA